MQRRQGRTIGTIIIFALMALTAAYIIAYIASGRLAWTPFPHVNAQGAAPESSPQSKPGATIVINPTEAECKAGWRPGLRWTEQQFAEFCAKLESSK
jgi:hypothetical protein